MVARLEQQGLIARSSDPAGRAMLISITGRGRSVLRKAIPVHAAVARELLLDRLTPMESEQLSHLLDRVTQ